MRFLQPDYPDLTSVLSPNVTNMKRPAASNEEPHPEEQQPVAKKAKSTKNTKSSKTSAHYFNEKFKKVDSDQNFALVSVVGPDVIQQAKKPDGSSHPFHGLVVWGTLANETGPEVDKMKKKAHQASNGLLDVYLIKACAMLPLKFSKDDFKLEDTTWADERVSALMDGIKHNKAMAQQFFDERKEFLKKGEQSKEMVGEELDHLRSDLKKMDEDREKVKENIELYEAKYAALLA